MIAGFRSGTDAAFSTGKRIGETLLAGLLEPLGSSGNAISQLARRTLDTIQGLVGTVFEGIGQIFKSGGKLVGAIVSGVGAGVGAAIGAAVAGPGGIMAGAVIGSTFGLFLTKAVGAVAELFTGVVGVAGKALGQIGSLFGELVSTVTTVIRDSLNEVKRYGQSVLSMHFLGGYGQGPASSLVSMFQMAGISPEDTARRFSRPMSPFSSLIGSRLLGLPSPDEDPSEFLMKGADRMAQFQKMGPLGNAMFRGFLNNAYGPGADEQFMPVFGMGKERLGRMSELNDKYSVDGERLTKLSQDIQETEILLQGIGKRLKLIFAEALLPLIQGAGEKIFTFLINNKDKIIDSIYGVADFLYAKLPVYLGKGLGAMLHLTQDFVRVLHGFVTSFQKGQNGFMELIGNMLEGFDWLSAGFIGMMKVLAPLGAVIYDFVSGLSEVSSFVSNLVLAIPKALAGAISGVSASLLEKVGLGDWADTVRSINDGLQSFRIPTLNDLTGTRFINPIEQFNKWNDKEPTDFRGAFENFRNSSGVQKAADGLEWADKKLGQGIQAVEAWTKTQEGKQAERSAEINALKNIAKNTEETARNTKPGADKEFWTDFMRQWAEMTERMMARVGAEVAEDATTNLLRV